MQHVAPTRPVTPVGKDFYLRQPAALDGPAVHALVSRCPPLDVNSLYCNLLQCSMFSTTCIVAERNGEIVGFISGFIAPGSSNTLFIWQVAVAPEARGSGLGKAMLMALLQRPACQRVSQLQTTVTPSNQASWALFESLAKALNATLCSQELFTRETHFNSQHETEMLVTIGKFTPDTPSRATLRSHLSTLA